MPIRSRVNMEHLRKQMQLAALRIENDLIHIMNQVGLEFVREARESLNIDTSAFPAVRRLTKSEAKRGKRQPKAGDYLDNTANLRGSIGYIILKDGVVLHSDMHGTSEGIAAAMAALQRVPRVGKIQLIAVAGMDYASYLESKGYNVITSQAQVAVVNLEERWRAYARKLNIKF